MVTLCTTKTKTMAFKKNNIMILTGVAVVLSLSLIAFTHRADPNASHQQMIGILKDLLKKTACPLATLPAFMPIKTGKCGWEPTMAAL